MAKISIVKDNPNPNVLSLKLEGLDILRSLSRISFSRTGTMAEHSALAQSVFEINSRINRFDVFKQEEGHSNVVLSISFLPFDENGRIVEEGFKPYAQSVASALKNLINNNTPLISEEDIRNRHQIYSEFNAISAGDVKKIAFNAVAEHAGKKAKGDGGDIVVTKIRRNREEVVTVEVVLVGACHGCKSATEGTLDKARNAIIQEFAMLSQQYPENDRYKRLTVQPITKVDVDECAFD